ncbi:hypothetical protein GQ43DRAFT_482224 [Delitschia confertaspora ATCC 74209]|uniref:Uncharacterized protein n=1 Tax=Delitschia confertaspora ATCC 74209 TaxID=1513339 RepID=A0A9P4JK20_9PLEO|nr:hypothetical protein GQ43DRAFT_482224 [Delitschia confertaspora ATCC 74209]
MSGPGDNGNRWRGRPGQGNQTRGQNQNLERQNSGTHTPNHDAGRQSAINALSGNVWGNTGTRGKGGAGNANERGNTRSPVQAQSEQHIPVKGFNAGDVREYLKKQYDEAVRGQPTAVYHKVQGDSVAKRSSGAWGSRGNMSHLMPNGQDFFTQLKKQLQNLDQRKTTTS